MDARGLTLAPLMVVAAAAVWLLERRLPASALRAPARDARNVPSASTACGGEPCLATCSSV